MPDGAPQTRAERADAETATELLAAAKRFFGEIMGTDGGRRSESDMNAFWAAIAALMPANLLENRGGRAAARILGVHHRVIEKGVEVRRDLEEHGKGWVYLKYNAHADRVDLQIIADWWHSELASIEDNQNKHPIRIYLNGHPRRRHHPPPPTTAAAEAPAAAAASLAHDGDGSCPRAYCIHWRRAQLMNIKESLIAFHASPHAKLLAEATKTAKRPNGVVVGVKLLRKGRCPCVKPRRSSECTVRSARSCTTTCPSSTSRAKCT